MAIENNFEKICRTCAQNFDDELHPIFVSKNSKIVKMLEGFKGFNFKISKDDELPKSLCDSCSKQLTQIYAFILQCETSEKILTEKLQKIPENITIKIHDLQKFEQIKNNDEFENYIDDKDEAFSSLMHDFTWDEENNQQKQEEKAVVPSSDNEEKKFQKISEPNDESAKKCNDKKKFKRKTRKKICKRNNDNKKENSEEKIDEDSKKLKRSLNRRDYTCNSCPMQFEKFATLREHTKDKHPVEPITYLCDVCGQEFSKRERLVQHKNRHLGIKPFKCDICEKTFSIKGSLRSHIQRHVNPENFTCDVCGKNFIIKKCYEDHVKRHESGEKLFKCPYCPRTFKLLSTLTHHCTFHNKTLDKKYHCSECNTNFRRSDHLKEHINGVHLKILPFKCEVCQQGFVTGAKRNIHVKRMHSGRRYQCNLCEKDFSLPSSLNRHKKSHSGIKSLICEICNESFVTPIQIERHMVTHQLDETAKNNLITQTYEKIKQIAINQDEIADSKIFEKIQYS